MGKFIDITGKKFGRLTVVVRGEDYISPKGYRGINWVCVCECGKTVIVRGCNLKSGASRSCGCIVEEKPNHTTHGLSNKRLYSIWKGIKDRCNNPNNSSYDDYGGRGISVCADWNDCFMSFYQWSIEHGYTDGLSINRIDNNGSYCPDNCEWADSITQANNTRRNHYVTYNGKTQSISHWEREYDIPYNRLKDRLKNGWDIQRALTTSKQHNQFG